MTTLASAIPSGLFWHPLSGTDIGIGYRSSIEHTLEGDIAVAGLTLLGSARTSTDLETPAIATASVRQRVSERLTLLGTVQWTDWSDLNQIVVKAQSSNPDLAAVAGSPVAVIPLNWHDGWFFSGGTGIRGERSNDDSIGRCLRGVTDPERRRALCAPT